MRQSHRDPPTSSEESKPYHYENTGGGPRGMQDDPLWTTPSRNPAEYQVWAMRARCARPEWSETADSQAHIRLHADNIPNGIVVGATPFHWERFSNGSHLD